MLPETLEEVNCLRSMKCIHICRKAKEIENIMKICALKYIFLKDKMHHFQSLSEESDGLSEN